MLKYKVVDSGLGKLYRSYGEIVQDWDFVDGLTNDLDEYDHDIYEETLVEIKDSNKYESEYYVNSVPETIWVELEIENDGAVERRKYELDLTYFWSKAIPVFVYQLIGGSLKGFLEVYDEVDVAIWEADVAEILHGYDLQKGYNLAIPVERYDDPVRMYVISKMRDWKESDEDFAKFQARLEEDGWKEI